MLTAILNIDIKDLVLILVVFFNFILGIFVFLKNRKNKINIYFIFTTLATATWALGLTFFRQVSEGDVALVWAKIYYVAAALIGTSFLSFSFVFPFRKYQPTRLYRILFYLFTIFVIFVSIWPKAMLREIVFYPWGKDVILGWPYYIYSTYFIMCMVGAFGNFIQKYKLSNRVQKSQIQYVFIGYILAAVWGVTFNLILPLLGNYKFIWLGPYFTLALIGFLAYSILKHHLMDVRVIATEIFSVLVVSILLIDALLAETVMEFIWKFGLFIGIAVFSVLLIRGVLGEIETRQKIAKLAVTLRRMNVKLKKLDKTKSEFISLASHQLRTPLSIIKGYISMILEGMWGKVGQEQKKRLEQVYSSNERLIKLVEDLLTVSRIESGRLKFDFQMLPLGKLTQDIVKDFSQIAADKGLYLKYIKSEKPLPRVKADSLKIRQVIQNLIDNAIHYTKKGGVVIRLKAEKNKVIFSIQDTGIGVSRKEQMTLFEKFSRGADVAKMYTEGTGLGLYLAAKLIETHQGRIWVESEGKNKGSTFYFELPIK